MGVYYGAVCHAEKKNWFTVLSVKVTARAYIIIKLN